MVFCMSAKVNDLSGVDEAKRLAAELLKLETRGTGDTEAAMRRLAHRYGLDWHVFWRLRYRTPKDVFVGVLRALREAHHNECRRQLGKLRHEIEIARLKGVCCEDIVAAAAALAEKLRERDGQ